MPLKVPAALDDRRAIVELEVIGSYCGRFFWRCAMVESERLVEGGLCDKTVSDHACRLQELCM